MQQSAAGSRHGEDRSWAPVDVEERHCIAKLHEEAGGMETHPKRTHFIEFLLSEAPINAAAGICPRQDGITGEVDVTVQLPKKRAV